MSATEDRSYSALGSLALTGKRATIAEKYQLEELLGEGGMGLVFRARNTLLDREVAIKILRPEVAASGGTHDEFLREARSANAVRHPNVVDVLDVGFDGDLLYIVQELLSGETLAAQLERTRTLTAARLLEVIAPVVAAVAHAHERGVLHRDIKPENVFLTQVNGESISKLVDFGLAQKIEPEAQLNATISGAPEYMSPALVTNSRPANASDDVWAFGVLFYECLTGVMPFSGATVHELFIDIASNEPTALEKLCPDAPPQWQSIVRRCLNKNPSEQFIDARALYTELSTLLPQRRSRRNTQPIPVPSALTTTLDDPSEAAATKEPTPSAAPSQTTSSQPAATQRPVTPSAVRAKPPLGLAAGLAAGFAAIVIVLAVYRGSPNASTSTAVSVDASASTTRTVTAAPRQQPRAEAPVAPPVAPPAQPPSPPAQPAVVATLPSNPTAAPIRTSVVRRGGRIRARPAGGDASSGVSVPSILLRSER